MADTIGFYKYFSFVEENITEEDGKYRHSVLLNSGEFLKSGRESCMYMNWIDKDALCTTFSTIKAERVDIKPELLCVDCINLSTNTLMRFPSLDRACIKKESSSKVGVYLRDALRETDANIEYKCSKEDAGQTLQVAKDDLVRLDKEIAEKIINYAPDWFGAGTDGLVKDDRVSHPSHYTWLKELCGIEVIDITRHMDFDLGNCVKYLLRAGHKKEEGYTDKEKALEDLKKAAWYLNDKIKMLENEQELYRD